MVPYDGNLNYIPKPEASFGFQSFGDFRIAGLRGRLSGRVGSDCCVLGFHALQSFPRL